MRSTRIGAAGLWLVVSCGGSGAGTGTGTGTGTGSGSGTGTDTTTGAGSTGAPTTSTGGPTSTTDASTGGSETATGVTGELTMGASEGSSGGTASTAGTASTSSGSSGSDSSTGGSTGEPPPVEGPFSVDDLEAGHGHACAALHSGKLKCWGGYSDSGDLGVGDTKPYGTMPGTMGNDLPFTDLGGGLTASAVTSYYHGCAVVDGGKVKCWGQGSFGALGNGAGDNLGDEPGEMGDKLPFVDLGAGRTALQVISAVWTSCAVLDDHSAKCWGWNGNGWLGQGDKNDRGERRNAERKLAETRLLHSQSDGDPRIMVCRRPNTISTHGRGRR